MIDLKDLRENPESYKKACIDKRIKFDVDAFLELDSKYRELSLKEEQLSTERNALNKQLSKASDQEREELLKKIRLWRFKDQKVAFTNGCFDIIPVGCFDY